MKKLLLLLIVPFLSLVSCGPMYLDDGSFSPGWLWPIIFIVLFLAAWQFLEDFYK